MKDQPEANDTPGAEPERRPRASPGEGGRPARASGRTEAALAPAVVIRDPSGPGIGALLYRGVGLLFLLGLALLYFDAIARVLLLAFVAAIVAVALNQVVERIPLPRVISVPLTALVTLGGLAVAIYFLGAEVARQLNLFLQQVPDLWQQVLEWQARLRAETGLDLSLVGERAVEVVRDLPGVLRQAFGLLEVVGLLLLVLIGAFFVVAEPNRHLLTSLMRAVPPSQRPAWYRVIRLLGLRLARWVWGSAISMAIIGTLSTVGFTLLDAPYPLLLGVLMGVMEVIPMVGPWIGGTTAILVTLVHDPGLAIWVGVVILVIQQVEGNLIYPVIMRGAVAVHPFVTLLALILFSAMFGLLGAILSVPLVLALQTVVQVFWVEERLGTQDDEIEPVVRG